MQLAAFLWTLGSVPLAMAGGGAVAVGPQPWFALPIGPVQLLLSVGEPFLSGRLHLLRGPWFAWTELPPRLALGRAVGPAWLALVRGFPDLNLAWEIMASPHLSLWGSLGDDNACGLRVRWSRLWAAALIRQGGLTLWCGLYF